MFNKKEKEVLEAVREAVNNISSTLRYPVSTTRNIPSIIFHDGGVCSPENINLHASLGIKRLEQKIDTLSEALGYSFELQESKPSKIVAKKKARGKGERI